MNPKVLFNTSFYLISELLDSNEILINIPKYKIANHKAILSKNDSGGFTIDIENTSSMEKIVRDQPESYDIELIDVELLIGNNTYTVSNLFISKRTAFKKIENKDYFSGKIVYTGKIYELTNQKNTGNELYNRFIIPIGKRRSKINYYINTNSYQDESEFHTFGRLPIKIDGYTLTLYEKKFRNKYHFVIDSNTPINSKIFSNICHSIMLGFGFLSSDFIQNEAFYITSDLPNLNTSIKLSYSQLRPSIYSPTTHNPIHSNPNVYTNDENVINEVGKKINVLDSNMFSTLCSKIYKKPNYASLILLIIEAKISRLTLYPASYSVALAKITNSIIEENEVLKPIPNKQLSKSINKKLKEVLSSFSTEIKKSGNKDSLIILQNNIDKINNLTDRDKLTVPFDFYKIKLSTNDLKAIDKVNNYLNGKSIKMNENNNKSLEILKLSFRLDKLINKLVLKDIGYSGFVINYLKYNEDFFDFEINEKLFEKL